MGWLFAVRRPPDRVIDISANLGPNNKDKSIRICEDFCYTTFGQSYCGSAKLANSEGAIQ
jgi:hypothetical protein